MALTWAFLSLLLAQSITAESALLNCGVTNSRYSAPKVRDGFQVQLLLTGLRSPRGIIFDSAGHLLTIESGNVNGYTITEGSGGCLQASRATQIASVRGLNHGLELSNDGKTLYASDTDKVYSWPYDPTSMRTTGSQKTVIQGMYNGGHNTRTLLMSKKQPGTLLASRGSNGNIDAQAADKSTAHSHIRAFKVNGATRTFDFNTAGEVIGWGLRNSVGVTENPATGGIWTVENSMDNLNRNGRDIHNTNPGEELNYHGTLADPQSYGGNYGYPYCFSVWDLQNVPQPGNLTVGSHMAVNQVTADNSDALCAQLFIPPRLTFPAHWAPLDIKFNSAGTTAYITSHGSWNRSPPDGYKLFAVAFGRDGQPVAPPNSKDHIIPIMENPNLSSCSSRCFRPVGLAWGPNGSLFMSSDSTGDIFVITPTNGKSMDSIKF